MKVLIFEDEQLTAEQLVRMLDELMPDMEVVGVLESVKQGIEWFSNSSAPDLVFMDIHLADASCFELFSSVQIDAPVIFTTAYDQYAIQAFKVNSIDYLLKPIDEEELKSALEKYNGIYRQNKNEEYETVLQQITRTYKKRFMVTHGDQLNYINAEDIAYFVYDESLVFAVTFESKKHIVNYSIEKLAELLNPDNFFRINRKFLISIESITKIHKYFNNRLKLELIPTAESEVIVSREKVGDFKRWLNQ